LHVHPPFLAAVKACLPVLPGVPAFGAISGVAMVVAGMLALHFFGYPVR